MHIVDGALSNPVVIGAAVLAVAGIARGLRDLDVERIPTAGLLSAAFFIAALIHVPVGISSAHLLLNGLAGLILGWAAFPTIFVGLLLQAVFFGFGGITTLGVNTLAIALPAVLVHLLCRPCLQTAHPGLAAMWGGLAAGLAVAGTAALAALALALSGAHYVTAAKLILLSHLPLMLIEAMACAAAVTLIRQVKPELFRAIGVSTARG